MNRLRLAPMRLAMLLGLFSVLALAIAFGGAALLDRDARRLRAGEAALFDLESLVAKLKGAADDPSAGPLLAAATAEIVRYAGPASDRVIVFAPYETAAAWPARITPLTAGLVRVPQGDRDAVGVVRRLPAGRLLVARIVARDGPLRPALIRSALITAALLLALSGLAAWLVGRLYGARLAQLNAVCAAVEAGDVAARVPAATGDDELALLSRHLNRMLAELERRIGELRASSDRIAHDLRTPLARVGSRLSLLGDLSADQHPAQIEAARGEIDALIEAFNGLLDLREIETESGITRTRFALADAVEDAIELYEAVAEDMTGIAIARALGDVEMVGVPALVTRAVANLIDNALRASPAGGTVSVRVARDGEDALVEVRDSGIGPPALLTLDDQRTPGSSWGGHGIGLSIVAAVARRHGGGFALGREDGRTVARLRLPIIP